MFSAEHSHAMISSSSIATITIHFGTCTSTLGCRLDGMLRKLAGRLKAGEVGLFKLLQSRSEALRDPLPAEA